MSEHNELVRRREWCYVEFRTPRPLKVKLWRKLQTPPGWKKRRHTYETDTRHILEAESLNAALDQSWIPGLETQLLLIMEPNK